MKISINRVGPLGIKEQIKRQIRHLIACGDIKSGDSLPSARDLAAILNVNKNTVAHIYKELALEGYVRTEVGAGTFACGGKEGQKMDELNGIFARAFMEAKSMGFDDRQITDFLLTHLPLYAQQLSGSRVLVIDCNRETIDYLCGLIAGELHVEVEGAFIQDIEKDPDKSLQLMKDKDLVVCGFNHVEEFRKALPANDREVVAVLLRPDIRIMNEIVGIPAGTRVGYCCANQRSTETFFKSSYFSDGKELTRVLVGLDQEPQVKEMLSTCEVVFATGFVYDRLREVLGPAVRMIRVDLSVDPGNVELVRERLFAVISRTG